MKEQPTIPMLKHYQQAIKKAGKMFKLLIALNIAKVNNLAVVDGLLQSTTNEIQQLNAGQCTSCWVCKIEFTAGIKVFRLTFLLYKGLCIYLLCG